MLTATSPIEASVGQRDPLMPTGFDCGAGLTKLCLSSNGKQILLRQPSKVLELKSPLLAELTSPEGGHFYYHSGDRGDLINRQFLTGELVTWKAPITHIKLSDDPALKAEYALHMVLGALASLPHRQQWKLFLVISTHSRKLFNDRLKQLLTGNHIVSFGGQNKPESKVTISLEAVVPEGAGSYSYTKRLNLLDSETQVIAIDLGTSTVIPQVFDPGGKLIYHQPLEIGGCIDLLEAIACDVELLQYLGTGKAGNVELIRQGIEGGEFNYGSGQFNFRHLYARLVKTWLGHRLRLAFKTTQQWRDAAGEVVAWGGGTQMPGIARMLATQKVATVPSGCWANAIGLQTIASALLARR
ncbi:MAG: hypothetical protein F6J89_30515 [Symploca sp. SIO1C4]|uniref:Actin-like protein N-terminal domain-containing protein n=1 Tax=Symploca sp. SIO1C4 TaxID=2607765 RepID=A0A6B3NEC5_9CYAN|nr:hypothetical protein [Symploca sp. SIO1C4]